MNKVDAQQTPVTATSNKSLKPLVELLRDELENLAIAPPAGNAADSLASFSKWFLEAAQLLETHTATSDEHRPLSRREIELMCRSALSASNIHEAMHLVIDFSQMLTPRLGCLKIQAAGTRIRFLHDSLRPTHTSASSLLDIIGLFAFKQLFDWLAGSNLALHQVGIGSMNRESVLPFLQLFKVPVLAEGEVYYLEYDTQALERQVVVRPGDFEQFFEFYPCSIFPTKHLDLAQEVSALISAAITQAAPIPKLNDIATALEIPSSTFRRMLAKKQTSFRAIRDQCLFDAAKYSLECSEQSIGQLAIRLGFKDSDSFRQAFSRWSGMSPSAWRTSHRG